MKYKTFRISSSSLDVEIALPQALAEIPRFDHTGFITQVTLDHKHTFCSKESLKEGEGSGGIGLCNEFGIFDQIGYEDAIPGDYFPKIGVGLLKKYDESAYSFFNKYQGSPFAIKAKAGGNAVSYTVEPVFCRGYAVKLEKVITVDKNILKIEYILKNTGELPIYTTEYCHNFLSLDNRFLGSDYNLKFNFDTENVDIPQILKKDGNLINWKEEPIQQFYCRFEKNTFAKGVQWELLNKASNTGVIESSSFVPLMVALWGDKHVVSPEVFVRVDVAPSQTQSWYRKYEFINL